MDYFGPVVNRAARVSAVAHGGQILCTDSVMQFFHQDPEKKDFSDFSLDPWAVDLSIESFNHPSSSQSSTSLTSPSTSTSPRRRSPRRNSESLQERFSPSAHVRKLSLDLPNEPSSPHKISYNESTTPRLAKPLTVSKLPETTKTSSSPRKLQLKATDVVFSEMGSHSLKGIYQPIKIHQVSLPSPSPLSLRAFPPLRLPKDSSVPNSGTASQSISTGSSSIRSPEKEEEIPSEQEKDDEEKKKSRPKFANLSQFSK